MVRHAAVKGLTTAVGIRRRAVQGKVCIVPVVVSIAESTHWDSKGLPYRI